ncbi:entericidin B [Rhizobium sp. RU33A]|uniref:entericidin domain-containing protein n=1 Tax=Rhizobium sp. RU33A TaxID=1907413 RepID=UPI0009574735|nr:entericidin B signal peptide protein [Rhizobium sp. RU33A]SIQ92583.1 entericidin B [Rhizobium sp. RU33A]
MTVVFQRSTAVVAVLVALAVGLSSCGNTIRGIGNDLGNAVDATQDAGRSVANSVR